MDSAVGPFFFEKRQRDFCAFLEPILILSNKQEQMLVPALSGCQVGGHGSPCGLLVTELPCGQQASGEGGHRRMITQPQLGALLSACQTV